MIVAVYWRRLAGPCEDAGPSLHRLPEEKKNEALMLRQAVWLLQTCWVQH